MERLAGPQLLNFWYSWTMPLRSTRSGIGVNVSLGVSEGRGELVEAIEGVGDQSGEKVIVMLGVESITSRVAWAMVCTTPGETFPSGTKTICSGGFRTRLTCACKLATRQASRSCTGGSWYTRTAARHNGKIKNKRSSIDRHRIRALYHRQMYAF